jgi:hypothetical protein
MALYLQEKCKIWSEDKVLKKALLKKGYDIVIRTTQLKKIVFPSQKK